MQDLNDRTAVITGGASGIGLALAHRFGSEGMRLVLGDVEVPALDSAVKELNAAGYEVAGRVCDVADLDHVVALEAFARETFGNVHVLCNNAGVGGGGAVSGMDSLGLWKWTLDVNLWGVIYGCKVFLPAMIEHGEPCHVVNTASMAGHVAPAGMGAYNVSKYGVVALSETLSREMQTGSPAVGVSVLCPAFVSTGIATSHRNLPEELQASRVPSAEPGVHSQEGVMASLVAAGIPPTEVADAVHDAVVGDQFWILTHEESKPAVVRRAEEIVSGINPPLHNGVV